MLTHQQSQVPIGTSQCVGDSYDIIIIGSGVGGLTCGLYLAKAGMKVLVLEKHYMAGGYCGSFRKKDYYFDAAAHILSSCRSDGQLGRLLTDHDIARRIEFIRCDPSDVMVTSRSEVFIRTNFEDFVIEFQQKFPSEADGIRKLAEYMYKTDALRLYSDLKEVRFSDLLDAYLKSTELKSLLSIQLGNIGLPSTEASAVTSVFLYREFVFDGGYYPRGGMQAFPDLLVQRIREYGGDVALLCPATRIITKNDGVDHVEVRVGGRRDIKVRTRYVVMNGDPMQLRGMLVDERGSSSIGRFIQNRMRALRPSISSIMVHLGVSEDIRSRAKYRCNVWSFKGNHIDEYYGALWRGDVALDARFVFFSVPSFHDPGLLRQGRHCIQCILGAPYKPRAYWEQAELKERIKDRVVERVEEFIPQLSDAIEVAYVATPVTLYKYTRNYKGAMYGWASTYGQLGAYEGLARALELSGIYLVGHWAGLPTGTNGVATVVASGRSVARRILRPSFGTKFRGVGDDAEVNGTHLGTGKSARLQRSGSTD